MNFSIIIPARFGSSRLPGKPLKDISGQTMIERVYHCAKQSDASRVIIATDHKDVFDAVQNFGGEACMTETHHESGTDRIAEVVTKMMLSEDEIVVNVQGDEPLMPAAVINQVARNLKNNINASAATLSEIIVDPKIIFDTNTVKIVCNSSGMALYFSRAAIPWYRDEYSKPSDKRIETQLAQRHIGIYAYRVSLLKKFITWPISPLEKAEKLEQLRILHNGKFIHVEPACDRVPSGVDTAHDLNRIRKLISNKKA